MMMQLTVILLVAVATAQQPTFRSSVEVTRMDVTVVDSNGKPLTDVRPNEFKVRIDGKDRRVVSAQWVALAGSASGAPLIPPPPAGYSTNEHATDGRLILIAIDQPNIRSDGALALRSAVRAFIDHLEPSDRIAAVTLGHGVSTPFTADREAVKEAISRMAGGQRPVSEITDLNIAVSEAIEISSGNQATLTKVMARTCGGGSACSNRVMTSAFSVAMSARSEARLTMSSLLGLLGALKSVNAPKTVVLVSEGFAAADERQAIMELGPAAAAAQTTLYVLKLDEQMFDMSRRDRSPDPAGDRQMRYDGVDQVASLAKGDVFQVQGTGSAAFARIEREVSGYYLVGVESTPSDADGKEHRISVQVSRSAATVRARRALATAAASRSRASAPLDPVREAMRSPLMMSGLALNVATFSLRDQDPSKIQVWIHGDLGRDYTSATPVALGYIIADSKGTVVVDLSGDARLAPLGNGPSPLVLTTSATLAPGDYMLKLVVNEGGRVGSVEHPIHAGLVDAGSLKLSELILGGPVDAKEILRPSIGYDVNFGAVQGYLEAYGADDSVVMRYEVASDPDGPSILTAVVPGRSIGSGRTVFSALVSVRDLPAGQYYLRATLSTASRGSASGGPVGSSSGGGLLKKMVRAFRVPLVSPALVAPAAAPAPDTAPARTVPANLARPFR